MTENPLDSYFCNKLTELCGEYGALLAELVSQEDSASIPMDMFRLDNCLRAGYQRWLRVMQDESLPEIVPDMITDDFGNFWYKKCQFCGKDTMQVISVGKAQCANCGK
jgi:hypothetical protein